MPLPVHAQRLNPPPRAVNVRAAAKSSRLSGTAVVLLALAFATVQVLIGGTRLVFSLPALVFVGAATAIALCARDARPDADRICLGASAIFFGYIVARALFSPVAYLARCDTYPLLGGITVYLLTACALISSRQRLWLVIALIILGIAHTCVGAIQFREGNEFMPISWLQRAGYGPRASGFYVCPNHLAGLLEVLGVFGLSIVIWSRFAVWAKLLIGYATAICYVGLVLTGSRGGYLSGLTSVAVLAVLTLIALSHGDKRVFSSAAGAVLLALAATAVVVFFAFQHSTFLGGRAQNTFELHNVRLDFWRAALAQWKLNPLFGTGSETYLYYGRQFRSEGMQADPVYVHNDYLQLLCEYGALGVAGFLVFLFAHLRRALRSFWRLGPKRIASTSGILSNAFALNVGAIAAVAAYLVHSALDFNLHIPANLMLLAFVFGVIANPGIEREHGRQPDRRFNIERIALGAIAAVLLVQTARLMPGEYFAERARVALREYHPMEALYLASRGLEYDQQNPYLFSYLARARRFAGDTSSIPSVRASFYRSALDALEHARSLAPRDETFLTETAATLDAFGRFGEAEWMFGQAFALDPRSRLLRDQYDRHLDQWQHFRDG